MPRGQEFICILEMVCITGVKFKDPNFGIKKGIVHSIFPSFQYCYAAKIHINFLLVKMKGNINKGTIEKMNRRESLELELGGGHDAPKFDCDDKKRKNGSDFFL